MTHTETILKNVMQEIKSKVDPEKYAVDGAFDRGLMLAYKIVEEAYHAEATMEWRGFIVQ